MANEAEPSKSRWRDGPRPIGTLVATVTRPAFRTHSAAMAQLLADWPVIVGANLAAATQPRRLTSGTLTLACAGPIALELQHLTAPLAERINAHFGRIVVQRFRFVQDLLPGALPPPAPAAPPPAPIDIPGLPPGPLRDALAALGGRLRP